MPLTAAEQRAKTQEELEYLMELELKDKEINTREELRALILSTSDWAMNLFTSRRHRQIEKDTADDQVWRRHAVDRLRQAQAQSLAL
jgi:hypothetical protein